MNEVAASALVKYRCPGKGWRLITITFPAAGMALALLTIFHWTPFDLVLVEFTYLYLLIAFFLPLCFIWIPFGPKASKTTIPWYDQFLVVLCLLSPIYLVSQQQELMLKGWEMGAPTLPFIVSLILWGLMIEGGRRCAGPVFAIIILFFSAWPIFSSYMPGFLWSPEFSLKTVASFHALGEDSIMGIVLRSFGRLVIGYMVFAVVVQGLGAGKFFNDLALRLVGRTRAGNAKVAIIASGFFGSISGSSTANVVTTGAFTIPAMKREGLPPYFAGAVEACASAGGCLMPPVMGAVAFIMAEFIQVPYAEIALVAIVPSILYYVCVFCQIDAFAQKIGLKVPQVKLDVPPIWLTVLRNSHILLSIIFLIFLLFFLRLASQGPWLASAVAIILGLFRKETRINVKAFFRLIEECGKVLSDLLGIMGPVGLIIGSFVLTGLAYSFPYEIVNLAGGNLFVMLVMGAAASFILGMGVAMQAVYIFLALVLAPGLVMGGFDLLAVHFFILYCAVWSTITPPVAITAFVAAAIAGASPMKTGVQAMKLGMAKYILPFIFINSPALILRGPLADMLVVIPSTTLGLIIISGALEGYFWKIGNLTVLMRILLFGSGILLTFPTIKTDLYGLGIFIVLLGATSLSKRRNALHKFLVQKPQDEMDAVGR